MSSSTIFTKSVRKTKKQHKARLFFQVLRRIIFNNPKLFIFCILLAIITAVVNYNIGANLRNFLTKEGGRGGTSILDAKFSFNFNFFGWKLFGEGYQVRIKEFLIYMFVLAIVVKGLFSLIHLYWNSYAYDSIERDLKKDLFRHFIRAKYTNSAEVSRNLITQFADDLDEIAYNIWFIPNRIIYVSTSIFFLVAFGFREEGGEGFNWRFGLVALGLLAFLVIVLVLLFKQANRLWLAAKKRQEKDNKMIYERINNLEYVKSVSGEKYEERKIGQQLDDTFRKNKNSLWYSVLFKSVPNSLIVSNIPLIFLALALVFFHNNPEMSSAFIITNFAYYFLVVRNLNSEVNKITDSLLTLDELSSSLTLVNESFQVLNRETAAPNLPAARQPALPFQNGDIIFQKVVFAYPKRPQQDILRNFTFTFQQGKSYGIAGKNGIGKSTITKTTLKLYELKAGQILIGQWNVQEIETTSLHRHICYQTNRPGFFQMSIAENVFYPNQYKSQDHKKLVKAAEKTGILEFINKLPKGFNTELREGGTDLSEGQKQQIVAMRIFIRKYDIYILDEILSNVHPDLKAIVLQNIFTEIKGRTTIVIDHHYEIFQYVDYVYQFTGEKLIRKKKEEFVE